MTIYASATDTLESVSAEVFAQFEQWRKEQDPQLGREIEIIELGLALIKMKELVEHTAGVEWQESHPKPDESDRPALRLWIEDEYSIREAAWPKWLDDNLASKFDANINVVRWAHDRMFSALKLIAYSVGAMRVEDRWDAVHEEEDLAA